MQELEREIEALRKDRARLEANLRDATTEAQSLRDMRVELASLKVSPRRDNFKNYFLYYSSTTLEIF